VAATKIADVIVPEIFNPYVVHRTTEKSALWTSGMVQTVTDIDLGTARGGTTVVMPFWNDLGGSEEILSDTVPLSVDKITTGQDAAVLHARGKAWGANDLAGALAGDDPMARIGDLVAVWWARRFQRILISTLTGMFAAASMSGMVKDISAGVGDAAVIDSSSFIDALYLLGDNADVLTAVIMHSAVVAKLAKDDLIEYLPPSEGETNVPFFMGKRVIVDDGMPVSAGTYTSYLFAPGAIGYVEGNPPVPSETDRDSLQGDDILINRRHFVLHPRGVRWQGVPAGVSPTNVELETGTNWLRVYDVKNLRVVAFKHKIA
jgi:hypothetical protein